MGGDASASGGTCFGDSDAPMFLAGTNIVAAVTSFGSTAIVPEPVVVTESTKRTTSTGWICSWSRQPTDTTLKGAGYNATMFG
ncbi:MAG: hypothetical protein GY722_14635 [bacterium]|nr:hypothetical protein [bacterium]